MSQEYQRGSDGGFYAGSRLLTPLCGVTGLPIDQVNFLVCQLVALGLAIPFRRVLGPKKTSCAVRHVVELAVGLALTLFCFGYQMWHLVADCTLCYLIMRFGGKHWQHKAVFVVAMGYLSITHIYRQTYDYGGYTLDITGPLMIMTEKLTSMAFSLHDGTVVEEEKLSADQRKMAIRKLPDALTFYSYIFYFHGILCGPMAFFTDYMNFMDGSNYDIPAPDQQHQPSQEAASSTVDQNKLSRDHPQEYPSPQTQVTQLLVTCVFCGAGMLLQPHYVPYTALMEEDFWYNKSLLYQTLYSLVSLTAMRFRYYFAWKLSEAINNAAGFGFSGYDKDGKAKWELLDNVDIKQVELSFSLKENIDGWNITTRIWLRRVVYDRVPVKYGVFSVFLISAIWHGFYPGYYVLFISAAFFTYAARLVRRNVRPFFLQSSSWKVCYDCITFCFTRVANTYLVSAFCILEFIPCIKLYNAMYWWYHILVLLTLIFFTIVWPAMRGKNKEKKTL